MNGKTSRILNRFNNKMFEGVRQKGIKYSAKTTFAIDGLLSGEQAPLNPSGKAFKRWYKAHSHSERAAIKRACTRAMRKAVL